MTEEEQDRPRRKPRGKRASRVDGSPRIIFRVTEKEREDLRLAGGDLGISGYIRARVFGGWTANRAILRAIAELHVVGRGVLQLASAPEADAGSIEQTLADVRAAIERLSEQLIGADAGEPASS